MNHTSFSPGTWTSFMASVLAAPCSHQLMVRTGLLVTVFSRHDIVMRCCTPSVALVPARGKKQKFGGFTRDPFKTFQKKLAKKEAQQTEKVPLMSRERGERMLQYPYTVTSLGELVASYAPLEKHAKAPLYTAAGRRQRWTALKEMIQTIYGGAVVRRKLKKVDPFRPIEFARWAQDQFAAVNQSIALKDKETLRKLTTETASLSLREEFKNKMFTWRLVENVERPRVVSARVAPYLSKENLFAQVVVRMHTKQIMAVRDLTGRLVKGDLNNPKKVIDYVVFERHLTPEKSNLTSSRWRICAKLPPQLPWELVKKKALQDKQNSTVTSSTVASS